MNSCVATPFNRKRNSARAYKNHMKNTIYIVLIFLLFTFNLFGQVRPTPSNYSVVESVTGDLDKDGVDELVVVYNTNAEKENEGVERELIIYKLDNNKWSQWKKSRQALYGSRDGGMMGDPFGGIEIKKGILLISHCGGSSWKWGHTDKYRFQDGEFYLIGYTSNAGKLCEYWKTVDFNISTGKIVVKKEYENEDYEIYKRENEIFLTKKLSISLQTRNEREITIVSPKYGHEIYISEGKE